MKCKQEIKCSEGQSREDELYIFNRFESKCVFSPFFMEAVLLRSKHSLAHPAAAENLFQGGSWNLLKEGEGGERAGLLI